MTSIKAKFRPAPMDSGMGAVYFQIIHERKAYSFSSGLKIPSSTWDKANSNLNPRPELKEQREQIRCNLERLMRIAKRLEEEQMTFTPREVGEAYKKFMREYSLFGYMGRMIEELKSRGRVRTSETYGATLRSFRNFREGRDIMLDILTTGTIEKYEAWLRARGVVPNTVSFYMRILRALYNRAVCDGVIENRYPFRRVYTGIEKTVKRAVSLSAIRKIKALDLSANTQMEYARDMFLMSFYLRGMSFVDMAFLRKADLRSGSVTYRRRKTGQRMTIGWTAEMQELVDKYPPNSSEYLLPIIRRPGLNERRAYLNVGYAINYNLKKVGVMAGLNVPLTLYVARHSWASAAKVSGIPLSVISEGMGHGSEATTQIYLASLDTSVIDQANSLILSQLK